MYLSVKTAKGKKYFSLMESYREDGKVKKRVVVSLGNADNASKLIRSSYPEFITDLEKHVGTTEIKEVVVPTNLKFADMSIYQRKFEQSVVAIYKDSLQKGTRFILKTTDCRYIMAYLYDGEGMMPSFWDKKDHNTCKRHWMIDYWAWESIESYKDFMRWYADLR